MARHIGSSRPGRAGSRKLGLPRGLPLHHLSGRMSFIGGDDVKRAFSAYVKLRFQFLQKSHLPVRSVLTLFPARIFTFFLVINSKYKGAQSSVIEGSWQCSSKRDQYLFWSLTMNETSLYTRNKSFAGPSLPAETKALRTDGPTDKRTDTPSYRVVAHD